MNKTCNGCCQDLSDVKLTEEMTWECENCNKIEYHDEYECRLCGYLWY